MGGEGKSRGRSLSPTHAACMARLRGGADALLVARTHPSALRSQRHPSRTPSHFPPAAAPHHPRHPLLTTTGGRAPSPTDGARIRHGAFASDTVYTHATPRGGAWDSLPGHPRLAPEPSRGTAGRPLGSTPPHTDDALALKALHPWRDARPAHTEGHVAAAPPALLPSSRVPPTPRPAPPRRARTYVHHRAPVRLPSQTATRGTPLIRRPGDLPPFPALRPHGSVSAPGTWPPPRTKTSSAPPGSN